MTNLLSILIPVRDEKENVYIIAKEIEKKIENSNYEIVFINDFSQDTTLEELEKLSKLNEKIMYFNNKKKGLGGAIDLGIQKSNGKYVCIMMSDSSDTVEDLNYYYKQISSEDLDAVFGSRFIKGGKVVDYPKIYLLKY